MANARIGPISKAVGENITRIIRARGLSAIELGRRTGIARQAIGEMVSGRRRVDADELVALATVLDVTVMQLLGMERYSAELAPGVTVTLARPVTLPVTKEAQP